MPISAGIWHSSKNLFAFRDALDNKVTVFVNRTAGMMFFGGFALLKLYNVFDTGSGDMKLKTRF